MTDAIKARRAVMQLGDRQLDVFQLPDGDYRMSQTQVAEAVAKPEINVRRFLTSKWLKSLPNGNYTLDGIQIIEVEKEHVGRGGTRINAVPLQVAFLFWVYQVSRGNKAALALVIACGTETLVRRADVAFGVTRTEDEYNEMMSDLTDIIVRQDKDLQILGENYAIDDDARQRVAYLEGVFRELGIDPDRPYQIDED